MAQYDGVQNSGGGTQGNSSTTILGAPTNQYYIITAFSIEYTYGNSNAYFQDTGGNCTFTLTSGSTTINIGTYGRSNGPRPTIAWTGSVGCPANTAVVYNVTRNPQGTSTPGIHGPYQIHVTYTVVNVYSRCTPPTAIALGRTRGTVTINWAGADHGTNNWITGYDILRKATNSTETVLTHSAVTVGGQTDTPPAPNTYVYAIRTRGSAGESYFSDYAWSGQIYVPSKPSVSAGSTITDTQMDNLRTWINAGGITDIGDGGIVYASHGNTYRNTLTAGTSKIEASWYNAAANG